MQPIKVVPALPPHPAKVVQPKASHPATVAQPKKPGHPATVVQPKAPHPATVAQPKKPGPNSRGAPPHPATVAQAKRPREELGRRSPHPAVRRPPEGTRTAGTLQRMEASSSSSLWHCSSCGEQLYSSGAPDYSCWNCQVLSWAPGPFVSTTTNNNNANNATTTNNSNAIDNSFAFSGGFETNLQWPQTSQPVVAILNNVKTQLMDELVTAVRMGSHSNPMRLNGLDEWFAAYKKKMKKDGHVGGAGYLVQGTTTRFMTCLAVNEWAHTEKMCAFTLLSHLTGIEVGLLQAALEGAKAAEINSAKNLKTAVQSIKNALKKLVEDCQAQRKNEKKSAYEERVDKLSKTLEELKSITGITCRYVLHEVPCGRVFGGSGDSYCGEFLILFAAGILPFFCPNADITWDYVLWN